MLEEKAVIINAYLRNLNYFAKECLKIKTKDAQLVPFVLNSSQVRLHNDIEETRRLGKKVRKALLKSRQIGFSTYTEARAFSKVLFNANYNAFIIAEKIASTQNIFEMSKRYYDNLPEYCPKPKLTENSIKGLTFDIDSKIRLATASGTSIGRSMTNQFLHCSEVALYENVVEVITGLLQTVPDNLESEIIFESTANGTSGRGAFFYTKCMEGLDPKSEWDTLFFPWFEHFEYRTPLTEPLLLSDEERELKTLYPVADEQLLWRRNKISSDFPGRDYLFKQEYPACIQEAFIQSGSNLINLKYLEAARKAFMTDNAAPLVIGVDPARTGDRTVIVVRQGRVLLKMYCFDEMQEMKLAGIIARLINHYKASRVFIDYGHGTGTYDRLTEQGYGGKIELVHFGQQALDNNRFTNKRAEMYDEMRTWFMRQGGVFIKDKEHEEELMRDLMLIPDLEVSDSSGRMSMVKKKDIVKGTEINSTDFADALALTFGSFVPNVFDEINRNEGMIQAKNVRGWQ